MSCTFCIVALKPSTDDVEPFVKETLASPAKVLDTETVSLWRGSSNALERRIPVSITLYKAPRRCRVQVLGHELSTEERTRLEDAVAASLQATVVSRHTPSGGQPVPSPLQEAVQGQTGAWPAWLPPPGFEPHPGAYRVDGDGMDEPGTYQVDESPG